MVQAAKVLCGILLFFCVAQLAQGQFLGIGGGGLFSKDLGGGTAAGPVPGSARSEFGNGRIFTLDVGTRVYPYVSSGLHYSFSSADMLLVRGDAFGSSAEAELSAHTITFDTRVRTPSAKRFRFYGLAGVGITRFGLDVKSELEVPFPGGAPDNVTSFVITYGAGFERHLRQLVHLRLEVRDYQTFISDQLFQPGGAWHRVAVIGGITVGL
ncbi:MAG: outer membrane beta-barrel protein [Acidobacteriota bacterium]